MKYVLSETAVSKLRGVLASKYGNVSTPYYSPASISPDAYPPPFAVRWAQSENSGQGAWVIWLPTDTSAGLQDVPLKLLMVGSRYIDFLSGTGSLSPAASLPSGWRILANDANGGHIYLNILRPLSNATTSTIVAGIETTARQPPQGEEDKYHVYSILIAEATTNADTGAKYVRQFVDSAITIPDFGQTDPGGGGGGEDTDAPLPYEVRFDKDLASGGAWKIYLPTEHLLLYNGEYIDTSNFDGITSIGDGWYSFDAIGKAATHVWLVVTDSGEESGESEDAPVTVEISATKGEPAAGEKVENICIAELSYTANGGDSDPTVEVWQSTVGAIVLGKNETTEPDDVSIEFVPEAAPSATPDGDEGKLQIKGFKAGTPISSSTLGANLSDTGSASSSGHVLVRTTSGTLEYKPIGNVIFPTPPTPPTVNDGTLTIKRGTTTLGTFTANQATGTEVNVKSETLTFAGAPTSDAGTGTQNQTYDGTAQETIHLDGLLTKGTAQTITGTKTINNNVPLVFSAGANGPTYKIAAFSQDGRFAWWVTDSLTAATTIISVLPDGSNYLITLGTNSANKQLLGAKPTLDPSQNQVTGNATRQIATLGWVEDFYLRLISATATATASAAGQQPTVTVTMSSSVQGGKKDTINFAFTIPAGAPGSPGAQGVGVSSATSGTPYQSGNTTVTPVTLTLTNGNTTTFNVTAQNGSVSGLNIPSLTVVTDVQWNLSARRLEISKSVLEIQNGIITSKSDLPADEIATIDISDLI